MNDHDDAANIRASIIPEDSQDQTSGQIVRSFLSAMERRDLDAARKYLSLEFQMTFPGNTHFTKLEELVDWGRHRYREIAKSYSRFDEVRDGEDTIIYCFGTLRGRLSNGSEFKEVRFIDRFTVRDNKLHDQQVWNDMGERLLSN